MDLLSIVSSLESNGFNRNVEHLQSFAGFEEKDTCVWSKNNLVDVSVDDVTVEDVWKVCLCESLEGVWYFVVLRNIRGKVVHSLFGVAGISSLSFG